ncbi:MAG: type II toxin-antitoxin system HipA family toxin [Prevotella sp.]|jgi:serine/threonine-protein kinase HipA|nr:type II toxin-antitoxin system HipA family toxin [Prevotella sp.]MCH3995925.1 type II toxin-antitoxin system HipA family toxin [Prevotella sp.]
MKRILAVKLWGNEIGRLAWDEKRRSAYFMFNPNMLDSNLDIAPLVAPLNNPKSHNPIYGEDDRKYQKLPPFIADSLPDDWGNKLFEYWRIENRISSANITPLEKLSFIGKRGMGALEFEPTIDANDKRRDKVDVQSLAHLAQKIYQQKEGIHILPEESITMQSLIALGTSAGGRQPKTIIAINKDTNEIRSGQVEGEEGFESYILKFGDPERSSAEIEMTYFEMARQAGINISDSKLWKVEGINHFLTKRFDRDGKEKLHTQTLAAIYPGTDSYEQLLWVCRKLRLSEKDSEEVFRRMVFNVLANNTDDHDKNFSFIMDKKGHWRLSPAYDITYIFNKGGYMPQEERCLMIRGKLIGITKNDVLKFASDNGIRKAESIIKEVEEAVSSFRTLAKKNDVGEDWIGRIETTIIQNLTAWNYIATSNSNFSFTDNNGRKITNAHIEQAYKGNYHLMAVINGKQRRFVIRKGTENANMINNAGVININEDMIRMLVDKLLKD